MNIYNKYDGERNKELIFREQIKKPNGRRNDYDYPTGSGRSSNNRSFKKPGRRRIPFALELAIDVIIGALLMGVFYVTNYGGNADISGTGLTSPSVSVSNYLSSEKSTYISQGTSNTTTARTKPSETGGDWRAKFADKFTSGDVIKSDTSYKSANVNVSYTKHMDNGVVYFVVDIYVADIKYLKTAFGVNPDKLGSTQFVQDAMKNVNGIVGINGDMCIDNPCLIIRNGKEYKKWTKTSADEFVMYNDGTMKSFAAGYNWNDIKSQGPYQAWGFGPMLLDSNGQTMTKFNSPENVGGPDNPRTAIGYYEPGHYCFVIVDGRQEGYSYPGFSFTQMSKLMYDLGCKAAFNLDGGGSTQFAFNGVRINQPCSTYRKVGDFIYITDDGYQTP